MNRQEAEQVYRSAWYQYCLTTDEEKKKFLEETMDYAQPFIAKGPKDPHWKEFTDTLPGFYEFWEEWKKRMDMFCEGLPKKCRP